MGQYYLRLINWKEENFYWFGITYSLRQQILGIGIMIAVFVMGVVGIFVNALYTLRAAFGSLIVLALLRYRYALLMAWGTIGVFIGSTVPFFTGNNFDSALTIPTLLLMTCMPVRQTFKRLPMLAFLLVFLLVVLAGIGNTPLSLGLFLTQWLLRLDYLAVSVLTIQLLTSRQHVLGLIDAMLVICTFISLYGIYGYFIRQNGGADMYVAGLFRISSIFGDNAPTLAFFLSLIIPLAFYRIFTLRGFKQVVVVMLFCLFLVTLIMTFTRTSLISVPISFVVLYFFLPSRKRKMAILYFIFTLALATVLVVAAQKTSLFGRFFTQDVTTLNNRTYYWQALLARFDPTQILGKGLNASYMLNINPGDTRKIVGPLYDPTTNTCYAAAGCGAHNLFIGTLYDHGTIGLALLAAVFVTLFINILTGARKAIGDHRILYGAALAAFINTLFQCLDSTDLWSQNIGIYFWIIVALPFALYWDNARRPSETGKEISDEETKPQLEIMQMAKMK